MWAAIGEGYHKGHGGLIAPKLATGWKSWKSMHAVPHKHTLIQSLGYPNPLQTKPIVVCADFRFHGPT
jgi:hypothetical protein